MRRWSFARPRDPAHRFAGRAAEAPVTRITFSVASIPPDRLALSSLCGENIRRIGCHLTRSAGAAAPGLVLAALFGFAAPADIALVDTHQSVCGTTARCPTDPAPRAVTRPPPSDRSSMATSPGRWVAHRKYRRIPGPSPGMRPASSRRSGARKWSPTPIRHRPGNGSGLIFIGPLARTVIFPRPPAARLRSYTPPNPLVVAVSRP